MKLHQLPSEFQEALPILEKIKTAGYEAYFVGGSVRDAILGRPIHDVDIATSSYPEETKQIFRRTVDVGIEHGTVLVLAGGSEYEVTTFRTEDVYVDFRRPSQVSFVRSLEEDLKRRDFTVNAFALDEEAQIIDKFDGLTDLENKVLRAVGVASERFGEDALRIMRGFRFAATLDFTIEEATFQAMVETAPLLEKISVERIFIEFDKLLQAPFWRKGLQAMIEAGAYHYLPDMADKGQELKAFLEAFQPDTIFATSEQAWAGLLLALRIEDPRAFCRKWKTSKDFQKQVVQLVDCYRWRQAQAYTKQICYKYGKENLILAERLRAAQGLETDFTLIEELDQSLIIHSKQDMVVNGAILIAEHGLKPGPHLGQILQAVEDAIVEGDLANEKEAIMEFVARKGWI